MRWFPSPFDRIDRDDARAFGLLSGGAGIVGIALAVYFLVLDASPGRYVAAAVLGAVGLGSLVISRRLFTNRSPSADRELVPPWLTLAVGALFIVTGAGNVVIGDASAAWMILPGVLALIFAWRHLRRDRQRPRNPADGA
jgi:hypothetical protein